MITPESTPSSRRIMVDDHFAHAPALVWKALTNSALIERWLRMPVSGFEPVVGNRFTYQTVAAGAWDGLIRCEILEIAPERRLVHSWRGGDIGNQGYGSLLDTLVTYTMEPEGEGTRFRIVHSGFVLPRNEIAFGKMRGGWIGVVERIGDIAGEQ